TRAWVEEAQSLSQRSLDLLRPTIRTPNSQIWFSYNPRHETDPVDVFFRRPHAWAHGACTQCGVIEAETPRKYCMQPSNMVHVHSTYRDNPFFPSVLRDEMEYDRRRDPEKYQHIWLGDYEKHSESRVFKNWRVAEGPFDAPTGTVFYLGADWGFSVDPTVLLACYIIGRTLYVFAEVYKIG